MRTKFGGMSLQPQSSRVLLLKTQNLRSNPNPSTCNINVIVIHLHRSRFSSSGVTNGLMRMNDVVEIYLTENGTYSPRISNMFEYNINILSGTVKGIEKLSSEAAF